METYKIVIGVDPGITGGISILEGKKLPKAIRIPTQKIIVNKKTKNKYDICAISDILREYSSKKVLFCQESVGVMPHEGSVSAFSFGRSVGSMEGIAAAFGYHLTDVRPAKWKSHFPQLQTEDIKKYKDDLKQLRLDYKTIEEDGLKKANKKEVKRINNLIKTEAKSAARQLVSTFYPELADKFVKKNSDGVAESLLIAIWAKENI
jgi:hypothetical protein